jgi:hypothetical protein
MNAQNDRNDAQDIIDALTTVQGSEDLQAEARTNPEGLLDRLGLAGVARHAVAAGFALFVFGAEPAQMVVQSWWAD